MNLARSALSLRMTCGMTGIGGQAYRRVNCQVQWKVLERELRLRPPQEQNS